MTGIARGTALVVLGFLVLSSSPASPLEPADPAARPARTPVLLELFTSEGCSSCPSADSLLRRLIAEQPIEDVEVIGLSEHVDYWDGLGWRDPFASSRFTERQQDYAEALGDPDKVYTPQVVIDGQAQVLGSDLVAIRRAATAAAAHPRAAVKVEATRAAAGRSASVRVAVRDIPTSGASGKLRVFVAIVQDGVESDVLRGENAKRRLGHDAVVRRFETIGEIKNGAGSADLTKDIGLEDDWASGKLRAVAFLQEHRTQRIVGSGWALLGS